MALNDQDIDEQMATDWAAIQEKHAVEPEPEPETTPEPEAPEDTRARDDAGRFTQESSKAPESVEQISPSVEPTAQEPVTSAKGTPLDITRAPSTWKPVARADFGKLPESVRAEIHRRETEAATGVQQLVPDAQLGRSIRDVAAQYKSLIDAEASGKPELAFAELMKTAALLRTGTPQQKRDVVLGVARQYGVDLGQPAQPGQSPPPTFQDPRVDQLLQHLQTQEQQRVQAEQSQLETTVTTWMEAKDAKGQPKYPYLGDVMNDMAVLVPHIRQTNPSLSHEQVLQSAYERATWANPDVRPLLQPATPANPDRVREAKRAASVNVPRRASQPSPAKPGKMEDTIEATARDLGFFS